MFTSRPTLLALPLLACLTSPAAGAPLYTVTDLGLYKAFGSVSHINNSGQIGSTGTRTAGATSHHAFLYSGGNWTDLGTLGGEYSEARAINDSGQVVGSATVDRWTTHGFLYSGGAMTDLGSFSPNDINNSGQIAGATTLGYYVRGTLRSSDGVKTDLGQFIPYHINNSGQMAGVGSGGGIYNNGVITPLGAFVPYDFNDSGQVAGRTWYNTAGPADHALLYSGGAVTDLGTLGERMSEALGINESGQVVGYVETYNESRKSGFLYDGAMHDLNDLIDPLSGWHITQADDINNAGQIVAVANRNGRYVGVVRLDPIAQQPPTQTVDEPAGVALLSLGLAGLGLARRRRSPGTDS